jgi:hypothetical protein
MIPSSAEAAHPCGRVGVGPERVPARFAVIGMSCSSAQEVTEDAYAAIAKGPPPHPPYYFIDGMRCITGLAGSELDCRRRQEYLFASTRPEDHPGQAHLPHPHPYWRHCAPPPAVLSGDMLAHRIRCGPALRLIRRVLRRSQSAQGPHIHLSGFTCSLHPYATRAISCRKGGRRVLSPLAG